MIKKKKEHFSCANEERMSVTPIYLSVTSFFFFLTLGATLDVR